MRNSYSTKRQETVRRLLVIIIIILLISIIAMAVKCAAMKACSNPETSGMFPKDTLKPEIVTPSPRRSQVSNATQQPKSDNRSLPKTPATTGTPNVDNNNQTGIPRLVLEGSLNDVFERLEQFKKLPASEKLVLLDVGHGGSDPGSISLTGMKESELNLQVARRVATKLAEKGYFVFMTRMGDYALANSKDEDMAIRKRIMHLNIFDCSISIHMNSFPSDKDASGVRVFRYAPNKGRAPVRAAALMAEDEKLAMSILKEICAATNQRRSFADSGNEMTAREPNAPAALIECGFISNPDEEKKLADPSYQEIFSAAVANGVEKYLNASN